MRYLSLLGLGLAAVLVSGAVMAASASAFELPTILPATAKAFTGKNVGTGLWETLKGTKVECTEAKATGTVEQPAGDKGTFTIDFEKCKSAQTGGPCTGLGEAEGVILTTGNFDIVVDVQSPALGAAILFLPTETHLNCSALVLLKERGTFLCLLKEALVSKTTHEFNCKGTKGDPEETEYFNEENKKVKITPLEISTNGGAFEGAALLLSGTMTFPEAVTIMD